MARILVIDDEKLVRDTIRMMLEFEGHEVVLALDGHDGVRRFSSGQFALVLCDIFMPNKAGLETTREIRDLSAATPIIAMTGGFVRSPEGQFSIDLRQIVGQSGATLMLAKPFRRDELIAPVQCCLG